jgi:poly-gamma-glutamate synthesis protein (capsule biosynthesis protein)
MPLRLCLVALSILLLVSACQAQAAPPPAAETVAPLAAVATSSPSPSPAPSATLPPPTDTPAPTATLEASPTPDAITTLLFTGVIVPARCVQAAIDASGNPDLPYEEVSPLITKADLAIGTLNATISDYPPHTGCVPTYVLVGSAENADALQRAGFDVMSVATNHIKNCGLTNCGDRAFFDTLDNLRRVSILPVGAGKNHAEAMQPVVVTANGTGGGGAVPDRAASAGRATGSSARSSSRARQRSRGPPSA